MAKPPYDEDRARAEATARQTEREWRQAEMSGQDDALKVTTSFGTVQARGPITLIVMLVVVATFAILYFMREHDNGGKDQIKSAVSKIELVYERLDEVGYILTLSDDQRRALHLDMPESLRRKTREGRDNHRDRP